jgi:hypothetical protein
MGNFAFNGPHGGGVVLLMAVALKASVEPITLKRSASTVDDVQFTVVRTHFERTV